MTPAVLALVAVLLPLPAVVLPAAAPLAATSCQDDVAAAMARADALPASSGKAALQEQIQRADIARHEGDPEECAESLSTATDVLDRIDAARAAERAAVRRGP